MTEDIRGHVVVVDKRQVLGVLVLCVIGLHLLNVPAVWFRSLDDPSLLQRGYIKFFAVGSEGKIPTWYSACTIFICSILLAFIALDARLRKSELLHHWAGLSLIFAYLSLDEAMRIHEMANEPVEKLIGGSGALSFGWVIPAALCLAVFGALYLRFLRRVPARTRWLFVASGIVYVSGALGTEMVSAVYWDQNGKDLAYLIITSVEEILEMSGIALFIYALVDHISEHVTARLRF